MSETFYSPEDPPPLSASQEYYDDEFRRIAVGPLCDLAKKVERGFANAEQPLADPMIIDGTLTILTDFIGDASWERDENSRVDRSKRLGSKVISKLAKNHYITRLTRRPGT